MKKNNAVNSKLDKTLKNILNDGFVDINETSRVDVEDFIFMGGRIYKIGIPSNAPLELRKYIQAGLSAYFLRNKSIDYTLKRFGNDWDLSYGQDNKDLTFEISQTIKDKVKSAIDRFDEIENKPAIYGFFAAEVCLIRLFTSFRAVLIMIRMGMSFEAACLSRLILEQIAWAYSVYDLEEGVFEVSPPKSITNLKNVIPYAGRLYGLLTKDAHITPSETPRYLDLENSRVILSSQKK